MYLLSGEYMLDRLSGLDKLDSAYIYIYLTQFGADLFMINADNKKSLGLLRSIYRTKQLNS